MVCIPMQGCLYYKKSSDVERYIYVSNGKLVEVEATGNFWLLLYIGYYLDLIESYCTIIQMKFGFSFFVE